MPKRSTKQAYDDIATMKERRWIPDLQALSGRIAHDRSSKPGAEHAPGRER